MQLSTAAARFDLRPAPRAALALTLVIAGGRSDRPAPEKLAKFYLDLGHGVLFADDRQVEYLQVYSAQPGDGRSEGHIHVEVDRLARLRRRLDAATDHWNRRGEDEWWEERLDLSQLETRHAQYFVLSHHPLGWWERPYSVKPRSPIYRDLNSYPHPLAIRLPLVTGRRLRVEASKAFSAFAARRRLLARIEVPIELDIQVWAQGPLGKDLDNMLLVLIPAFRETLLASTGELSAFRIYYSRCGPKQPPPMIRVRLLPIGAIHEFDRQVDKALEESEAALDQW